MERTRTITANVINWANEYDGPLFHAMLTDPPYHLHGGCMTKPRPDLVDYDAERGNPYARIQTRMPNSGFMGQDWDGGDVAFRPETWELLGRHLYPGAFMFAFASTRGWHRMAVAIEDAGFVFHPSFMVWGWTFGSGFPKATKIGEAGRDVWAGHRYGRQALKPAVEIILCAQKPYGPRPVEDITRTGAGALWIDGARIETDESEIVEQSGELTNTPCHKGYQRPRRSMYDTDKPKERAGPADSDGRWPPNFVLIHHPMCKQVSVPSDDGAGATSAYACAIRCPGCGYQWAATELGRCQYCGHFGEWLCSIPRLALQSGPTGGAAPVRGNEPSVPAPGPIYGGYKRVPGTFHDDEGAADRFYFRADWSLEMIERLSGCDPVKYQGKASSSERDAGLFGIIPCAECGELHSEIHIYDAKEETVLPVEAAGKDGIPTLTRIRQAVK